MTKMPFGSYCSYLKGKATNTDYQPPIKPTPIDFSELKKANPSIISIRQQGEGRAIITYKNHGHVHKVHYPSGFSYRERICPGCKKKIENGEPYHGKYHEACFNAKLI
jgi:hypothetical protein